MSQKYPQNNIPTIIVVLGATGDLMAKKIVPSVLHLFAEDKIPNQFKVVGFARRPLTDETFREHVASLAKQHEEHHQTDKAPQNFFDIFSYQPGEFGDGQAWRRLVERLKKIDAAWGVCSNKLFYLAVPPDYFAPIFKNLAAAKLNVPCGGAAGWTRVLVEKPFGRDLASAVKLEKLLARYFRQDQLYRIDHYLAKEIIQGIINFRFSNNLLESSWNHQTVEKVEIRLLETLGAETRGSFYDAVGALRDVGQNHLLEMLAAITMDYPASMQADELRAKRAALLGALKPWSLAAIKNDSWRAQYDGYQSIVGVNPKSKTETYFKLKTELTVPAWRGVPIYLEAGKRCATARKEIVVTFKHPPACLLCTSEQHTQNRVIFSLAPADRISINFWTKKPGYEKILEERTFDFFVYKDSKETQYVEEYSKLILACILGDQTLFVSHDEVQAQWKFVDRVLKTWQKNVVPLRRYAADSDEAVTASAALGVPGAPPPIKKEMAVIGLGKMGANMARRMMEKGWRVVGYNLTPKAAQELAREGLVPAWSLAEVAQKLSSPKIIWLMVPASAKASAGKPATSPVDEVLFGKEGLIRYLQHGDIVIDGGNSYYKDTIARGKKLRRLGIKFLDCGTSGGPGGARRGACLMIGGNKKDFLPVETLFKDFALPGGYQFFAGSGAGHFVKMVHNGIEYGMMQALAEGFAIMKKVKFRLDLTRVADVYNHGSVIESSLVGWLKEAFELYGEDLASISGSVGQLGEGAWTVKTASEMGVADKVIHEALLFRLRSARRPSYTGQVLSALRNRFGGHAAIKKPEKKLLAGPL